jgi:hypothetical protein
MSDQFESEQLIHYLGNAVDSITNLAKAYHKGYVNNGEFRKILLCALAEFEGSALTNHAFSMD